MAMASMSLVSKIAALVLLCALVTCEFGEESNQVLSKSSLADCLGKCRLGRLERVERPRREGSTFRSSCYQQCLKRSKADQQALTGLIFKRRTRKSLPPVPNCPDSSPNQTVDWAPGEVNVTFGQYENTSHWYVNISWTPINDSYGNWTGILLRLLIMPSTNSVFLQGPVICTVCSKNQTFVNLNITSYGYQFPNAIQMNVIGLPYSSQLDETGSLMQRYEPITSSSPHAPTAVWTTSDCPDSSPNQTVNWAPGEVNVTFGQYENTSHWYVNISWTPINDSYGNWTGILLRLLIMPSTNSVFLQGPVICTVCSKNQTFVNLNITSYGYQFPNAIQMNVIGLPYSSQLDETGSLMQRYEPITSSSPHAPTAVWTTSGPNHTTVYVSISIGVLVGIVLVVGLLRYFLFQKRDISLPPEFEYHAFIIYNHEDSCWVTTKLLPLLEEKHHLKCCIHYRDFKPGGPYQDSMAESVYKSYKIIAVLSNNFLKSNFCNYELDLAKYRLLNRRDDSLIIIRIDKTDYNKLPRELRKRNFIDYSNLLERPFWEEKLLKFLNVSNGQSVTVQRNNDSTCTNTDGEIVISNNNNNISARCGFSRLISTTSNDTEISTV
ncbi:uncharacterized protein LOC144633258 isoform X2 [Oculina patagonica]